MRKSSKSATSPHRRAHQVQRDSGLTADAMRNTGPTERKRVSAQTHGSRVVTQK